MYNARDNRKVELVMLNLFISSENFYFVNLYFISKFDLNIC